MMIPRSLPWQSNCATGRFCAYWPARWNIERALGKCKQRENLKGAHRGKKRHTLTILYHDDDYCINDKNLTFFVFLLSVPNYSPYYTENRSDLLSREKSYS